MRMKMISFLDAIKIGFYTSWASFVQNFVDFLLGIDVTNGNFGYFRC